MTTAASVRAAAAPPPSAAAGGGAGAAGGVSTGLSRDGGDSEASPAVNLREAEPVPPVTPSRPPARDVAAWATNVLSSASIVMFNKQLMGSQGYAFNFATTLCAFHFILTAVSSRLLKRALQGGQAAAGSDGDDGKERVARLPLADLVTFVIVANMSIVSLNTSLMLNNVSLYQIAKLAIPPFSAMVETQFFAKSYSQNQYLAMALTLVGVALVTVSEFNATGSTVGVCVALLSIVSSGMQQILCGHYQKKNAMSSNDFLAAVSAWQGASMIVLGPICDRVFIGEWPWTYAWVPMSVVFLALSCCTAVVVNASHFMCLGRFSAVSYQVMGHAKTVLVIGSGYALFGGVLTQQQICGMTLAVCGMALYAYVTAKRK